MLNAIIAFAEYLATSVVLLVVFVYIYARATPYKEFALIAHDNIAVASPLPAPSSASPCRWCLRSTLPTRSLR